MVVAGLQLRLQYQDAQGCKQRSISWLQTDKHLVRQRFVSNHLSICRIKRYETHRTHVYSQLAAQVCLVVPADTWEHRSEGQQHSNMDIEDQKLRDFHVLDMTCRIA